MAEGNVKQFLSAVWGNHKGYVFLPFKDQERIWHETPGISFDGSNIPVLEDRKADAYFCPVLFSKPRRKKEYALSTNLLWADLDPVHPDNCRLKPSISWESSPGRYQALWYLSSEISADDAAALSKRIAYADGGDKGGWDVTQVLRIPGTRNFKYESTPPVKLLWAERFAYSVTEVMAAYPSLNGSETSSTSSEQSNWKNFSESAIQSAIQALPIGLRRRITKNAAGADRSKEIQLLARDLLRRGVDPEILPHILQRSTFNKFAGRPTEHADLLRQVESAQAAVDQSKAETGKSKAEPSQIDPMQVRTWGDFLQIPTKLQWLVDEAWVDGSVGFISGRSKSYKTWIALDMALSLVSGAPFLGKYDVRRPGPVVLVQEEDPAPVLQERLRLIGKSKGMLPQVEIARSDLIRINYPDYPLHIINLQGFNLGTTDKIAQIRELIARVNPVAVILDPLIVMLAGTGADEFKASEISEVLQGVKMWREEFGCSVIIVHHWNKTKSEDGERFAQHMYGSFVFHAWLESALHVMPVIEEGDDQIDTVVVEREFKASEISEVLQGVKMWREEFGCSVIIVHHWNKTKAEDGERFAQ
ncbi:MAG TPA: AAA family ATPase, partial [Acidobacteriota bacterium]|nr:AAA family ATPase [Acidobacteriota bacterium]